MNAFTSICALGSVFSFGLLAGGCRCEEDRPYTPFSVASSLPTSTASPTDPALAPAPTTSSAASLVEGVLAPPRTKLWNVFGVQLKAPGHQTFRAALKFESSSLIIAYLSEGTPDQNGLWLMSGTSGKPEKRLLARPSYLPGVTGCSDNAVLSEAGSDAAQLTLTVTCAERLLPRTFVRTDALVRVTEPGKSLLELKGMLYESEPGPRVRMTAADADGDGALDVGVRFLRGVPDSDEEQLEFRWLSRPAGLSRLTDQPARALRDRASRLTISAVRKAERGAVPLRVANLRKLFGEVCSESSTARFQLAAGGALECGELRSEFALLTANAAEAFLGQGRRAKAVGEVLRATWFGAATEKERESLSKLLRKKLPSGPAEKFGQLTFPATPRLPSEPQRLLFGDGPRLFFRKKADGIPRQIFPEVPGGGGGAGSSEPSLSAAYLSPKHQAGFQVRGVIPSCERPELELSLVRADGMAEPALPLPLLAPRPGACRKMSAEPIFSELLGYQNGHTFLVVGGEPVSTGPELPPTVPVAIATSFGLVVERGETVELWENTTIQSERECAVSRNLEHAACLNGNLVTLWSRPTLRPLEK